MIRIFLLLIAMGSAISAGWVYVNQPRPEPVPVIASSLAPAAAAAPVIEMVRVLGARNDLTNGQNVSAEDLEWIEWPADFVLSGQIVHSESPDAIAELAGQVVNVATLAGEPVRRISFGLPAARPISERLAPGMRAVAVRVNLESAVGGFVLPNDRVDVIYTNNSRGDGPVQSSVVVFNARVIAIDQTTEQGVEESIMVARSVTLELDRTGAEAIASAQTTGQLTLALRATADNAEPSTVPPSISQSLAPGMRAVVLRAEELATGSAVQPGDRIDLIHRMLRDGTVQPVRTTIATNVRVIAVDAFAEGPTGQPARGVLLELDAAGVDALSAALGAGSLSLSLRSAADVDEPSAVQFPTVPASPATDPEVRVRRGGGDL